MVSVVTLAKVRAFIGARMLRSPNSFDHPMIGSVTLRPHQLDGAELLQSAIDEFGGAVLCDQVGMGKTFAALALCGIEGTSVVAPAVLRAMWSRAADSAGKVIDFVSTESLSRSNQLDAHSKNLVIVDEAHHFRNPRTRRYDALARLTAGRRVLLVTATPVHNKKKDLAALLSLFLGSGAVNLTQAQLGRLIIRREAESVGATNDFPKIEPPIWCDIALDEDIPRLLLDLPPPLPPREGGDGGALVIHSLLRQWSSSNAALERALVRRLQRSIALINALENGTYPSRAELSAWSSADDSIQLAFAGLVATASSVTDDLLPVVRRHADAVASLLATVKGRSSADVERAALIRRVRQDHAGVGVVAFSQYADTVDVMFRQLSPDGYVAALTGEGSRVSGGRITRREAMERFAPVASGVRAPRPADSVTLLLTTDLLSEGVNLQDAGVVIHLDLPWTPARMEQRLGRVSRMGSPHERVFSYGIRPPATAETLIHLERVLLEKVKESSHVVDVFPSLSLTGIEVAVVNTPRLSQTLRSIMVEWSRRSASTCTENPIVAAVAAPLNGFLALCETSTGLRLLAGDNAGVSDDPSRILALVQHCSGAEVDVDPATVQRTFTLVARHLEGFRVTGGTASVTFGRVRRAALKRIATIVGRARPHARFRIGALAVQTRSSIVSRIGAEGERQLDSLLHVSLTDEEWMSEVLQIGTIPHVESTRETLIAAILLVADGSEKNIMGGMKR